MVRITIIEDGIAGCGEGRPTERYGENCKSAQAEIARFSDDLQAGLDREALAQAMKPSAARNAVDCALWDLEAKKAAKSVWALAGRSKPQTIETAFSISLGTPQAMTQIAGSANRHNLIKLKLGGDGDDAERIKAVRQMRADARLIADANEALCPLSLPSVLDAALAYGVEMIEQPLPAGKDQALAEIDHPVIICADESCLTSADIEELVGRYEMVNIKLDKTGGLTEALKLESAAHVCDLKVMVGCMFSTSLGIAPAQLIASKADLVDLDAPLYLATDRKHAIHYDGSAMEISKPELWG